jgi:glycosyltransferase involved in cell wall biosynthesis
MRILVSSCLPLDHGGYPNQLNYLLGRLWSSGQIKLGVICWNFTMPYCPHAVPLSKVLEIDEFRRVSEDMDLEMYGDIDFYMPENLTDFWKKLEIFYLDFKPDIILMYQDILILPNYNIGKLCCKKYLYLPVHDTFHPHSLIPQHIADPDGKYVDSTFRFLPLFDKIATMSQFGKDVLESYRYQTTLIPHAIDQNVWIKLPPEDRKYLRDSMGIDDDCFVCLMVASNTELSNRKAFDYNMRAFRKFSEKYPNSKLILKCNMSGVADLVSVARALGITGNILNVSGKIRTFEMVRLYNIANVLLSASKSEGFGIPIVESQMCGTPVITTNCTAMPENTHIGICTEPKEVSVVVRMEDRLHNSWSHPDVDNLVSALERIRCSELSADFPKTAYSPDALWGRWKEFLEIF